MYPFVEFRDNSEWKTVSPYHSQNTNGDDNIRLWNQCVICWVNLGIHQWRHLLCNCVIICLTATALCRIICSKAVMVYYEPTKRNKYGESRRDSWTVYPPTCVGPAVATLELLQLLLQLHLPPPLHHRLRVRDAPREARLRELTIELLGDSICSRSLVLLPVELGLFVVLLLLLLLPFRQLPFEAAALGREGVGRGVVLAVHARRRVELQGRERSLV